MRIVIRSSPARNTPYRKKEGITVTSFGELCAALVGIYNQAKLERTSEHIDIDVVQEPSDAELASQLFT